MEVIKDMVVKVEEFPLPVIKVVMVVVDLLLDFSVVAKVEEVDLLVDLD